MKATTINSTTVGKNAIQSLQVAIVDAFMDVLRVRFDGTITEVGDTSRADYIRGRVAAVKEKLQSLRDLEKRQREADARKREIKRENDAHRSPSPKPKS